jgi:hypothetical protein
MLPIGRNHGARDAQAPHRSPSSSS